jgi:hypothetical protein
MKLLKLFVPLISAVFVLALGGCASESTTSTTPEAIPTTETTTVPQEASTTPEENSSVSSEEDEVGSSSHATDQKFCSEHRCEGNFESEDGMIAECKDGTFSHAGGIYGACSYHGGEAGGGGGQYSENEEEQEG